MSRGFLLVFIIILFINVIPNAQQNSFDTSRTILQTVEIRQSAKEVVKSKEFLVDVLDVKSIRNRNADINRLLDAMPGLRVRETGGLGSSFDYSIHGLSGKAVRFFLDGVPMESFGAGFTINNIPPNAIDRIEVYKGVTPIEMGDALGGAINIVTRKDIQNFLDVSYSYGSFQTHRTSVFGKYRNNAGLTVMANASYNYSANNYKVWGNTVEIADEDGRPITGNKYRRFNDDFTVYGIKTEIGFTNTKWTDQLLLGLGFSDMHKGIQTGRTMAFVYGDVRYKENFLMPSLRFAKKNLFIKGLNTEIFAAINSLEGQTIDTGSRKYNWAQDVIASPVNAELDGIYSQKSIFTFKDNNSIVVSNISYRLSPGHTISLNYNLKNTRRKGKDDIAVAEWTIPFREPQSLNKQTAGLSYQALFFDEKWTNLFFVKNFNYRASANIYDFNGGSQKELFAQLTTDNSWGAGYATKLTTGRNKLVKFSIENASRLPDAIELLGDGNRILNSPGLKPERSLNINAAIQQIFTIRGYTITAEAGIFYRNTRDLIWLGEGNLRGTARYENIDKIRSRGVELSTAFSNRKWLEINMNATYQDVRNRLRYTSSGAVNIVFNDKMKNMPSLMANAEARFIYNNFLLKGANATFYVNTHYVEKYFLSWPSLGDPSTKKTIPEQFVQDAGLTYSLRDNRYNISLECRNIFNKQVYDNYLLQKPGRFTSIMFRIFFNNKPINN